MAIVAYPFRTCNLTIYNQTKTHLTTCLSSYIYILACIYQHKENENSQSRKTMLSPLWESTNTWEIMITQITNSFKLHWAKKTFQFELKWIDIFSPDWSTLLVLPQAPIWLFNNVSLFIGRLTHPFNALNRFPLFPPSKSLCLIKVLPKITY